MMWDWVGFGFFFTTLLLHPPSPPIANCRMLPRKRKGRRCGLQPPRPQSAAPLSPTSFLQKQRGRQERDDYFRITKVQRLGCRGYSGRGSVPFLACLMPAELATCCRVWVRSLPFGKEKGKSLAFPWVLGSADWHSG